MSKFLWSLGILMVAFGFGKIGLSFIQYRKEKHNGRR